MQRRSLLALPFGLLAGCASAPRASSPPDARGLVLSVRSWHFPRATIVLTNTGAAPVFLYSDACSWGYFAATVEFSSGSTLIKGCRKQGFTRNFPHAFALAPGQHVAFPFILDDAHCFFEPALPKSLTGWKVRWKYDTAPAVEPGHDSRADRVLPVHLATEWMDA